MRRKDDLGSLGAGPGELIEERRPSSYRSGILLLIRGPVLAELSHLSTRVAVRWAFRSGRFRELVLLVPSLIADAAARVFRAAQSEELAVVESLHTRKVIGLLTEQHLLRRYAEELDRARRDLTGGAA